MILDVTQDYEALCHPILSDGRENLRRTNVPCVDHRLQGGYDAIFSDLEEVPVARGRLEKLHRDCSVRVCRNSGLDERIQQLPMSCERVF